MINKIKYLSLILLFFSFSCNNSVKESWDCPVLEGGKGNCVSIERADEDNHLIKFNSDNFDYPESQQKISVKLVAPKIKELKKINKDLKDNINKAIKYEHNDLRTGERIGKIWFAPFIDEDGNRHSDSIVYVVEENPRWVIRR